MRCLVIDDSVDDRSLVERMLRKDGHRPLCVESGPEALNLIKNEPFDVAIVDLGMAEMSGAETIRALKRRAPGVRLLVVSGYDDRTHVLEALDAGADGFLLKPELGKRLSDALHELLGGGSPMSARVAGILLRHVAGRIQPPPSRDPRGDRAGEIVLAHVPLAR
jgi:DNA-binding NarL/FixJ family response regulator